MDDRTVDRIFAGCLENLPPVSSKIVRIFTSSTFTDTTMERNTLMAEAYPRLKDYCRERHGLEFQVVDMRWGVRDEATDDHMTTELCMKEIENCQRLSMGPNFVVLLGQKYGYRPLPTYILGSEFSQLREVLVAMGTDVSLLDTWYMRDTNAVPAVYILQPISSILVNFNNKRVPQLQQQDQATWWEQMCKMQKLLRKAAHTLFSTGKFEHDTMHNYFMAVTEREVIRGILTVKNTKNHCLAYLRYINNINMQNIKRAGNFVDIANRSVDTEAANLLADLRDHRIPARIESTNLQKYNVEWIGREGLDSNTHEEYLRHFVRHFYKNMVKLVDRAMRKEDSSAQGQIVTELLQHLHSCNNIVKAFYGRETELEKVKNYIVGSSSKPLLLYGEGGCGKTSLLAKSASMTCEWLSPSKPLLILRFLGTTPDSSAVTPLLISLCHQISYNLMLPFEDIPDEAVPLTAHLKQLLTYATEEQPLMLFLDSVDQLTGSTEANRGLWLPTRLPPQVKIVVSCAFEPEETELSRDYLTMRKIIEDEHNFLEVKPLSFELAMNVIKQWMVESHRDVSNRQMRLVSNALTRCSLPVFVKLVFAEICRWKSYTRPQDTHLAHNVMDSIMMLFEKIEKQHGKLLVSHALAYVTASKSGLSESELEDLISLDDKVLDDVYQYHLPPTRRIPPLLWTRIRNDLPNYLSEREADGVSVLNWYHRQFKEAAMKRYFTNQSQGQYFHAMIADYFLGIWGGGKPKPFRYTEIQRYRFNLKEKEGAADRKVPLQPLMFNAKEVSVVRYNLRKFGELSYHLVRAQRYDDLYTNVLFCYRWLHAKLSSCPLQTLLSDFEDACANVQDRDICREIMLVADALRLGGAILSVHPDMLAAQLVGRLLPESSDNASLKLLLQQCDEEGPKHCALLPAYHCLHTPGGPLKYSLEGHQFAVFGFRLTSDLRYIISVSNKFITWDLSTSDLTREVNPGIEGIMQNLQLSPSNKFASAHTNNSQTVLLNLITSEYIVLDNPFNEEPVVGTQLTNNRLVIYSHNGHVIYDVRGNQMSRHHYDPDYDAVYLKFRSEDEFYIVYRQQRPAEDCYLLVAEINGKTRRPLHFQGCVEFSELDRHRFYTVCRGSGLEVAVMTCDDDDDDAADDDDNEDNARGFTQVELLANEEHLLQLQLLAEDSWIVGTFVTGFQLWRLSSVPSGGDVSEHRACTSLYLPDDVRNVRTGTMTSNSCMLNTDADLAVAGVRKNLYIWRLASGDIVKVLDAHFGRIIQTQPLTIGSWNSVVTSSLDRTVKVWNINNIFERVYHIDRHEVQVDSISLTKKGNLAVTSTRACVGVWHIQLGRLLTRLADSALGAIISHAAVTEDGRYIVSVESSSILIWEVCSARAIFKQEELNIKQLTLFANDCKFLTASKTGAVGENKCLVRVRGMPSGQVLYHLSYQFRVLRPAVVTCDNSLLVVFAHEALKDYLHVFRADTGTPAGRVALKYRNYKDFHLMMAMPNRGSQVALIDNDKGNLLDVVKRKLVRSVARWNGAVTSDGRYGLYAPARGGLEVIELRHGRTVRTLIPKMAEGVFSVITRFSNNNRHVIYYHSGKKTLTLFRLSDGQILANYRVSAELTAITSSSDGCSLVLGTVDGQVTCLAVVDPVTCDLPANSSDESAPRTILSLLPSRNTETRSVIEEEARLTVGTLINNSADDETG